MAVYQIVKKGDPILREKAKAVLAVSPNIVKLLDNMRDTMHAMEGVGLAAPQIGIAKRVIVIDTGEEFYELINPELICGEGSDTRSEGCLSIPGIIGDVTRYSSVKVKGLDRNGVDIVIEGKDILARALQHEMDHLDGILFIDKAENIRPVE